MGILDKYGIKEVADVTFYAIDKQGKPAYPVLFLDTLKVSTIEQTGEEAEARGGKGNSLLLLWDYGKEINVSLEDALFSPKSMSIKMGQGGRLKHLPFQKATLNTTWGTTTSPTYGFIAGTDVGEYALTPYLNAYANNATFLGVTSDSGLSFIKEGVTNYTYTTGTLVCTLESGINYFGVTDATIGTDRKWYLFNTGATLASDITDSLEIYYEAESSSHYMRFAEFFIATADNITLESLESSTSNQYGWDPYVEKAGKRFKKTAPMFTTAQGKEFSETISGEEYFCTYDLHIKDAQIIDISADTFPGIYYIVGDTYARNAVNGEDEYFQFIIPKAKIQTEQTITLEAEGDPTTFSMNLRALRGEDGAMMKLVKYKLDEDESTGNEQLTSEIIHNHELNPKSKEVNITFTPFDFTGDDLSWNAFIKVNDTTHTIKDDVGEAYLPLTISLLDQSPYLCEIHAAYALDSSPILFKETKDTQMTLTPYDGQTILLCRTSEE